MEGKITFYSKEKGYGFITADNMLHVFFHISNVECEDRENFEIGDPVTFDIAEYTTIENKTRIKAVNIKFDKELV